MAKLTEEQKNKRAETRAKNKAIKEAQEKEERYQKRKQESIKKTLNNLPQEPKRTFEIGQKVRHLNARWENCIVKEILAGGRLYNIEYDYIDHNYGNKIKKSSSQFSLWYELVDIEQKESTETFNKRHAFMRSFQQFNMQISSLINKVENSGLDFNPSYQRELVWDLEDKEALIDSIFNRRDIGKFAFCFKGYDQEKLYEVLDGKQRLSTIMEFIMDGFPYKGVYYSELSQADIREFEDVTVSVSESRDVLTQEEKCLAFLEMNTRGKLQNEEHIKYVQKLLKESSK